MSLARAIVTCVYAQDMTRQYKSMQENLMREVNQAHDSISKLREELDLSKNNMDSKQKYHQKMIAERDVKIREQKRKMEDMVNYIDILHLG